MNNKKKITIRYFLYILGGAVLGACLSLVCFHAKIPFENLFSDLYTRLLASSPWLENLALYPARPVCCGSVLCASGKGKKAHCRLEWLER